MEKILPGAEIRDIPRDHPLFHTVYEQLWLVGIEVILTEEGGRKQQATDAGQQGSGASHPPSCNSA